METAKEEIRINIKVPVELHTKVTLIAVSRGRTLQDEVFTLLSEHYGSLNPRVVVDGADELSIKATPAPALV